MSHFYRPFGRVHLFELHEQQWMPTLFRDALTEWLRVLWDYTDTTEKIAPLVETLIHESGAPRIVDLCSGASGPIVPLQKQLWLRGISVPVILTDKYPNTEAMSAIERLTGGSVTGERLPIDACCLPPDLNGVRTIFNSFHHFRPPEARAILIDAFRNRQPIGIFELTEPKIPQILLCFLASFLSVFFFVFLMKPKRLSWWVFTWIIPLIPLMIGWDALVSHLRCYTPKEFAAMTSDLIAADYKWVIGSMAEEEQAFHFAYALGVPLVGKAALATARQDRSRRMVAQNRAGIARGGPRAE